MRSTPRALPRVPAGDAVWVDRRHDQELGLRRRLRRDQPAGDPHPRRLVTVDVADDEHLEDGVWRGFAEEEDRPALDRVADHLALVGLGDGRE